MLDEKQALAKLEETVTASANLRRQLESWWALGALYDGDRQWGFLEQRLGATAVMSLQNIVDPRRSDPRVTFNKISEFITRIGASLEPPVIDCKPVPSSTSTEDRIWSDAAEELLERWADTHGAVKLLAEKERPRLVLGSIGIRRTLEHKGDSIDIDWSLVYPWEVVRDPAAVTLRPERDEEIFAHEKIRTVEWIKRHFPKVKLPESETTAGQLMQYQQQMATSNGMVSGPYIGDSKQKAFYVYEAYFKDPAGEGNNPWPHMLLALRDVRGGSGGEYTALWFGRNPFDGLPFHFFHYQPQLQAPWCKGITHCLMQQQNILNIGMSWVFRVLLAGAGKVMYEAGTIDKPADMLDNRIDKLVEWKRNASYPQASSAPTRLQPPMLSPGSMEVVNLLPRAMMDAINLSDVQMGNSSKRGESGDALSVKLQEAGLPLEALRRHDEATLADLLMGTLADLTNPDLTRADLLQAALGADVPYEHALVVMRKPAREAIRQIQILPATFRPKTPADKREELAGLASVNIISADVAKFEMMLAGVGVDSVLAANYRKQTTELQMLMDGRGATVSMTDHHGTHRKTIELFSGSDKWLLLEPDAQAAIQQHWTEHFQAEIAVAQGNGMLNGQIPGQTQPGQPSPSSVGVAAVTGQQERPAGR